MNFCWEFICKIFMKMIFLLCVFYSFIFFYNLKKDIVNVELKMKYKIVFLIKVNIWNLNYYIN